MEMFESIDQLLRLAPGFALKFIVAVLCGGAIGMERETTGKPAGLRTNILVCVGSMIFTVMSVEMAQGSGGDPTRIAAQIVAGVGFLGAGAILHQRGNVVKGMTTAAMIWLMAALGMMIGYGFLLSASAVTAASVFMILSLQALEQRIHRRLAHQYRLLVPDTIEMRERVSAILNSYEESVQQYGLKRRKGLHGEITLHFDFVGPTEERRELLRTLYSIEGVRSPEM